VSHNYQNKESYKRHSTKEKRLKILGAPEKKTEQKIKIETNSYT